VLIGFIIKFKLLLQVVQLDTNVTDSSFHFIIDISLDRIRVGGMMNKLFQRNRCLI